MPVRRLPEKPSLDHLKHQARDLLKSHAAREIAAAQRLREFHPHYRHATDREIFDARLKLADAQLAIARESGFPSWTRLKRHIEKPTRIGQLNWPHHERIEDPIFRHAVDLLDAGDAAGLRKFLNEHRKLVQQHIAFEGWNYFHNPTLLEFIAENPIRRGKLPENIVEVAEVILDAGADRDKAPLNETLALVATGSVPHQCKVQRPLIDLLCRRGADPNSALEPTALHGYPECVMALLQNGAKMTFPVAAALGRVEDVERMLATASAAERHQAMAMASGSNQVEVMRRLLAAGENPDRYNPVGGHSHATPLHQAAGYGTEEMVRLLVEHGARADMRDILWHGTPADWARHMGRTEIEEYLRGIEKIRLT